MLALLVVIFVVVPIAELAVIVQVAHHIGVLDTLALLLAVSVVGAWLCKHQGMIALRRFQTALAQGELPAVQLVDGVLILLAGALLLVPGFITDAIGLILLLPPVRAGARVVARRRLGIRAKSKRVTVVDVRSREVGRDRTLTRGRDAQTDGRAGDRVDPQA
jgi:UPF0716 protein FxsA